MIVYRCNACGNVAELLHDSGNTLMCCGKMMSKLEEKDKGDGSEKHLPVVEGEYVIRVGKMLHPMESDHLIEWIEVGCKDGIFFKKFFSPGEDPILEIPKFCNVEYIRAYCNLHGLWVLRL